MIETSSDLPQKSSDIFENFRELCVLLEQFLGNLRKVVGDIQNIVENVVISTSI